MTFTGEAAVTVKSAKPRKPATSRATSPRRKPKRRAPSHREIAERAYYLHIEHGGSDELGNWLRAERELTAA